MPKDSKNKSGFQSSAGLIRYFDSEDEKAPKINPYYVLIAAIVVIAAVSIADRLWPT
jgi:preprotein translocase subunit Sec61beta